jgi:capsular exopolysaccharide synthesis family protein
MLPMGLQSYPEDIDFGKYWLILKRHWLPSSGMFTLVVVGTAVLNSAQKPIYEAEGKLLFKKQDGVSILLSDPASKVGQLESLSIQSTPIDTEAEILRSTPLIEETLASLNLKDQSGQPLSAEDVLKQLSVKGVKGTDIVSVSYKGKDPKTAAKFVNQLIGNYLKNNVRLNRAEATAAREFITQQLPQTESRLQRAEADLRVFEEQNQIVSLPEEAQSAVTLGADLNRQLAESKAELDNTRAQTTALQQRVGLNSTAARAVNAVSQSPGVQQVVGQLQKLEAQLTTQRTRYQPAHPAIIALEEQRTALQQLLQERVRQVVGSPQSLRRGLQIGKSEQELVDKFVNTEVTRLGLANKVQSLRQSLVANQQRATLLPRLQQQQRYLQRQLETAKANYEILVKRLQEVQIAENQNMGNARIVAIAPVPKQAVASKRSLMLGGGVLLGGLLYILTASVLDLRDPSLKTVKDVRAAFAYTCLGLIPLLRKQHGLPRVMGRASSAGLELPVRDAPFTAGSEAYRMLQSNLRFLNPDRPIQTVTVTSATSGEGKSTVAANLALALAEMNHRVLLIDADLHHPVQHHIWGLTNLQGLTNLIMRQVEIEDVVSKVQPNLSVLSAGSIPPNPLALITSNRMTELVQEYAQTYDFLIFDTPPVGLIADALNLGKLTDGLLFVARPGMIDQGSATRGQEVILQAGLSVLGLVINGVVADNEPDPYLRRAEAYYGKLLRSGTAIPLSG